MSVKGYQVDEDSIKQIDVNKFIISHPTYLKLIRIPDSDIEQYFKPSTKQWGNIKNRFYHYKIIGINHLIDEMQYGNDYLKCLSNLKSRGYGIPIRVYNWGYQEPMTIDELLDNLYKNDKHWGIVYSNSLDRSHEVEKMKLLSQKLITDFND